MSESIFRPLLRQRAEAAEITLNGLLEDQLVAYYLLLAHWNNRINLTGFPLEPPTEQAVDRLFVEPLVAASLVKPNVSLWFDLGSGGDQESCVPAVLRIRA